jgi:hypothetical protein
MGGTNTAKHNELASLIAALTVTLMGSTACGGASGGVVPSTDADVCG